MQAKDSIIAFLEAAHRKTSFIDTLLKYCGYIGLCMLFCSIVLTFIDVLMRYIMGKPISGTVEITGLLMALVVLLYTGYAQACKKHIIMDIVTLKLNIQNRYMLAYITYIWSAVTIITAAWAMFTFGMSNTKVTPILSIPFKPVIYICALGCLLLCFTVIRDIIHNLSEFLKLASAKKILCSVIFWTIPLILAFYYSTHRIPGVDSINVGLVGMVILFLLFFLGMPVAFALMATGLIFVCVLKGNIAGMTMFGKTWFSTSSNYTWAPLMSFMFMGYACYHGRFGEDLYKLARAWLGHLRGGLAQGSVVACALFGAVVGDVLAGSIAMAAIALPEMRKNRYSDSLALGTLACSGTIGALIPPSTTFILYGVLAEQSISELFMAGFFPGILCALCFMLVIWICVLFKPELAPRTDKMPLSEQIHSLKGGLPIVLLFVIVIGGIYSGMFTATEGGAIGACSTLILALLMGRLTVKKFFAILKESGEGIAMCFTLLGGANVLGYFMTMSRIPTWLATSIAGMDLPSLLVLIVIILVMCFLGCFLPAIPLILICVPIFLPIAQMFQWDLIWFGVIIAILNNMASITPPFGISLFVMKGVANVPLGLMFRAAIPFVAALFVCMGLIIAFPDIATFLPNALK